MKHDTFYYGGEILNTINHELNTRSIMDRGGKYIWVEGNQILYCDMRENDNRGSLEVHKNGSFKDQIDYNGILTFNEDNTDYDFTEDRKQKIINFLKRNFEV